MQERQGFYEPLSFPEEMPLSLHNHLCELFPGGLFKQTLHLNDKSWEDLLTDLSATVSSIDPLNITYSSVVEMTFDGDTVIGDGIYSEDEELVGVVGEVRGNKSFVIKIDEIMEAFELEPYLICRKPHLLKSTRPSIG